MQVRYFLSLVSDLCLYSLFLNGGSVQPVYVFTSPSDAVTVALLYILWLLKCTCHQEGTIAHLLGSYRASPPHSHYYASNFLDHILIISVRSILVVSTFSAKYQQVKMASGVISCNKLLGRDTEVLTATLDNCDIVGE